ncbi:MAG TPA: radical SAM protein [Candidatus Omnitrophota bacterium]|nr:radical SAM protein [Candidatus Omnitrophota bacterium]
MNIFLVYVRDANFYQMLPAGQDRAGFPENRVKVMAFPPLSIQVLAPILRQRGHKVHMFDMCHPEMKLEHIAKAVASEKPDVIALSFLSATTYQETKKVAKHLKGINPAIPVIVGGPFATINAEKILKDCVYIDCVGVGEGEELFPEYLDNIEHPGSVAGLVWRSAGKIVKNTARPLLQDLDKYPYPDRNTLPIDYIESLPLDVPAVLSMDKFCTIQTSRGCPYSCIFCNIPLLLQHKSRCRSAEHVLGELQELYDMGYRSVYFTDEHFLLNGKRINEICQGMIERNLKFRWGCEGRVDSAAIDQMPIMSKANCKFLAFGIEAGTQKVLDRLKKRQTLAQIQHAINEAKRHGIERVHGFFLIGSPDETKEDILSSFRFAARLKLDTFGFNRLCVYRGSPLWQEYVTRSIVDDDRDWDKGFKCSDIDPTVLPSETINAIRKKGYTLLFGYRILGRPIQSLKLLFSFGKFMKMADIIKILISPFIKRKNTRRYAVTARMDDLGLKEPDRT